MNGEPAYLELVGIFLNSGNQRVVGGDEDKAALRHFMYSLLAQILSSVAGKLARELCVIQADGINDQ